MDTTVAANPGSDAGSQSAGPSTALDNPSNLNFWEPEDDQAKPEDSGERIEKATEPVETAEGGQEAEFDEGTEQQAEPEAHKLADDALIDLGDGGEKVSLRELKDRGLRERDYQLKRARDAETARHVQSQAAALQQSVNALAELVASRMPSEPDPSLAYTDYQTYAQQKAIFDATQAELHAVLQHAHQAQAVSNEVSQVERTQRLNLAAETLASDPEVGAQIRDPAKARQFFDTAYKAAEAAGFTRQELQAYTDPRAFKMAWLAGIGQQALAAKAKAQAKVEKAPAVVAPQRAQQAPGSAAAKRSRDAMARLTKTGRLKDVLDIDF